MDSHTTRIAILGSYPPLRAISSYCSELAHALAEHQQVVFLSFKSIYPAFLYPGGKLEDDHSFPQYSHPNLQIQRRLTWYNPFTWLKAGFFTRADVLHAQWWSLPLLPVYLVVAAGFRLRGKPVVITIHNVVPHEPSFWFSISSRMLYKLGQHFIVHSQQNKQQLMAEYAIPEERISVIAHGPLELFTASRQSAQEARQQLGLKAGHDCLLLFGAIRPYKGIDTALQALALVIKQRPQVQLLIAGKLWGDWTPYARLIEKLRLKKHVITHLDYIPTHQVGAYFQAADLVLLPYHHFDSQSGIGSAALAFEKPLIVSDTGGLPELVALQQAQIVPPKDARALADAILWALQQPQHLEQMQKNAKQVRKSTAWPHIAQETSTIYQQFQDKITP